MHAIMDFGFVIMLATSTAASPFMTATITNLKAHLNPRQTGEIGYLSFCNACTGTLACSNDYSFHWGELGDFGGCNDVLGTWNSICEPSDADGDIVETPLGDAKWVPVEDCPDGDVEDGTFVGTLEVQNDDQEAYDCYAATESFSNFCGQSWACNVEMTCTYRERGPPKRDLLAGRMETKKRMPHR